ncbi:uncharacterized protein CIMG_08729 [Coccidioides immitis RS]|uniref:Uncharacterized protein n=1 Tax=Coccidioides immitis (strain RS) TaxID=246410 RepID=J3K631_COCIM|nr:uncharacterized protein CIMG_08729 [Coccidioides immitis RS]EAS29983.3 hypothetical protein CIMG_08729 [Coccidioides immitis RS]
MGGFEWTDDEVIVAVYFASRGVYQRVIADLLSRRGFCRTPNSVNNKLVKLKEKCPELGSSRHWNHLAVDSWLHGLLETSLVKADILEVTEEDLRIINQGYTFLLSKGGELKDKFLHLKVKRKWTAPILPSAKIRVNLSSMWRIWGTIGRA